MYSHDDKVYIRIVAFNVIYNLLVRKFFYFKLLVQILF